jgi:fatty acid desaturase
MTLLIALTWRLTYYAPGTFIQLRNRQKGLRPTRYEFTSLLIFAHIFNPFSHEGLRFWGLCILPTGISRFVIIPALFLPLGVGAAMSVFWTVVAAELLTNLYTFILIASSHTGDDIYRFDVGTRGRPDFYRHQLLGTTNYKRGPLLRDFLQMWINYQIEHHIFPNLPPSKYAICAAEVEAICQKHNVPYQWEHLHRRMWRMLDVVVGNTTMLRMTTHNEHESIVPADYLKSTTMSQAVSKPEVSTASRKVQVPRLGVKLPDPS